MNMKKLFYGLSLLTAVCLLSACEDVIGGGSGTDFDENTVAFTIGGNSSVTRGAAMQTVVAPHNVFDLPGEADEEPDFCLVETVTDMDEEAYDAVGTTRGTPVYTENFASLYGTDLYGTAYKTQTGTAQLTDVWGSYLENGGTVNFKPVEGTSNTYAYDYSRGQKVNLAWPEDNKLLYFLQAPYATTSELNPEFYADGHIEFDYTDPTTPVSGVITNGAAAQKDFLFTSKVMEKDTKDTKNHVLLYHALTGVKFKFGNVDQEVKTEITKVTIKGIKANGHCTIKPSYGESNTSAGENPSNVTGASGTKSSSCSTWGKHSSSTDLVVDYSQTFSGLVDYTNGDGGNSNYGDSFYDGTSNLNNFGKADGSEILMMIPQVVTDVVLTVDFTINGKPFQRSVKLKGEWKAGELHTYTLTVNKVDVSVDDNMNEAKTMKSGVVTANTGNVTAYLRAAYSVAWFYGHGDDAIAVAAWGGHGKFTTGDNDGLSAKWIKGEDGFYYYPYPVMPGRPTQHALFTTFTAPKTTEEAPFPGGYLDMMILLQGVQYDSDMAKVKAAWGTIKTADGTGLVVDKLLTTPENDGI